MLVPYISVPQYIQGMLFWSRCYEKAMCTKQPMSDLNIINMCMILIYDLRYNGAMQMNRTCMLGDLKKNM